MTSHATELTLRKLFAGETVSPELKAHSDACEECKAKLRSIEEEQRKFETAIPFERFAAGVERASRQPREVVQPPRRQWLGYAMAVAAGVVLVAAVPLLLRDGRSTNGIKGSGGDSIDIKVGGTGAQRSAATQAPEALSPGERVRVSYDAKSSRHIVVVSVDEKGEISSFPESGMSQAVSGKDVLPDSIEFTGRGAEHLVVVMTRDPISVEEVRRALRVRYDEARGNLSQLGSLDIAGEQFHYTFLKP